MSTVGRPRVLDEYKRREVCALVSAGCGIEGAARYVGCNTRTIRREALRNPDFHEQLRNAELACELEPLRAMKRAAATHWRAAAWLLERTQPNRFARRGPDAVTPAELDALMQRLSEAIAAELPDQETFARVCQILDAWVHYFERLDRSAKRVRRDPSRRRPPAIVPPMKFPADQQVQPPLPT
jgi:hypothetical protein